MTGSPHRPRFVFGATDLTLDWAARPWAFPNKSVGGVRWSAADIPASYEVVSKKHIALNMRVQEYERMDVDALIEWGKTTQTFTFWPDASNAGTSYQVRLVHPHAGEDWEPQRDDQYPHQFFVRIVLVKVSGAAWTERYFDE